MPLKIILPYVILPTHKALTQIIGLPLKFIQTTGPNLKKVYILKTD